MKIITPIIILTSIILGIFLGRFLFIEFLKNDNPADFVNIRVINQTGLKIKKLWIGAQSGTYFQDLEPGKSPGNYKQFKPVLSEYRKINFITEDDKKYLETIYPENFIGQPELSKGSFYTLYIKLDGEKVVLDLKKEE